MDIQPDDDLASSTANQPTNSQKPEEPCGEGGTASDNYTLQPYTFPRKRKSSFRGRRPATRNNDNQTMEEFRLTPPYKKFLTIRATDETIDLRKINTIKAYDELSTCLGESPDLSETRKGTLIFQSKNELTTRKAKNITTLAGIPITVEDHDRLNETRGTIWYANHPNYSEEEILDGLRKYGVKAVYRTKQKQGNSLTPTSIYILTFDHCNLPSSVLLGWTKCSVRLYVPKPRRCFKCQAFGHGANNCRREVGRCVNCSLEVHELPCEREQKCANCQGNHPANSTSCPMYRTEQEVLATQAKENIPYLEARRRVRSTYVRPQVTFATAVTGRNGQREPSNTPQQQPNEERPSTSGPTATPQDVTTSSTNKEKHTEETATPASGSQSTTTNTSNKDAHQPHEATKPKPSKHTTCKILPGSTVVPLQGRKRPQEHTTSPEMSTRPKVPRKPDSEETPSTSQEQRGNHMKKPTETARLRTSSLERLRRPSTQHDNASIRKQQPVSSKAVPPDIQMRTWNESKNNDKGHPIPTVITTQSRTAKNKPDLPHNKPS